MEASRRALTVVMNPSAGRPRASAPERVRAALAGQGCDATFRVVLPGEVAPAVREAAAADHVVAVAGGDGTLSAAAGALAGTGGVLVPFPLGTRNHFARRLGIASTEAAARAVAHGRIVEVPLGSVDGRIFINHASAGLYPRMVRHRARVCRWTGKALGNVVAGSYVLLRLHMTTLTLDMGGTRQVRASPGLWVGLGPGAFRLPVDGHGEDRRLLEVVVAPAEGRLRLFARGLRALWHLYHGETPALAGLEVLNTPLFTLDARHAIDLSRDGEVERANPPLTFRIHADALRVLVPPE